LAVPCVLCRDEIHLGEGLLRPLGKIRKIADGGCHQIEGPPHDAIFFFSVFAKLCHTVPFPSPPKDGGILHRFHYTTPRPLLQEGIEKSPKERENRVPRGGGLFGVGEKGEEALVVPLIEAGNRIVFFKKLVV
jgi:hypothetical protein